MNKPTNFRRTITRCCLGCRYRILKWYKGDIGYSDYSFMVCKRDDDMTLEDEPEFCVCDGYKKPTTNMTQ